ncbi:TetR/AcrR family transcriptional regulator [Mycolicibacterium pulveris]|uniref:TetR/AcrR family transcriptional regulator n=1 Tax=Mycolicibacterium pulveris TaxID=36813 RepID=UPI003CF94A0F
MAITKNDTRQHLLAVAERLLLENGYENVSIRAVCTAAGVNTAAVHYHFGSKAELVSALLESRLGPLWEDALTSPAASDISVADAVRVVVEPLVGLASDPAGRLYLHLLSRLLLSRNKLRWTERWFSITPWAEMLQHHVAGLTANEAAHRWMLAFELIFTQFGDPLAGDRRLSPRQVRTLQEFVTAGLVTPAVAR